MTTHHLMACHECDLLQREVHLPPKGTAACRRCGGTLYRNKPDTLDRSLAFTLGAAVLFILSNLNPVVGLEASGNRTSTTLYGTVQVLHDSNMTSVGVLVFVTTILMPALEITAMLYLLLPLRLGWVPSGLPAMFRLVHTVRPWGMVEVFMLGTLVSLAKLAHIAAVVPGVGLYSFGALMFVLAAAAASFEPHEFWAQVEATSSPSETARSVHAVTEPAR